MSTPVVKFLSTELEKLLVACPDDRARVRLLAQQYGAWQALRQRFLFEVDHECQSMSKRFDFGVHGWISATDFLIFLNLLDRRRAQIERQAVPA